MAQATRTGVLVNARAYGDSLLEPAPVNADRPRSQWGQALSIDPWMGTVLGDGDGPARDLPKGTGVVVTWPAPDAFVVKPARIVTSPVPAS
jgi:hypothetical protein